MGDGFVVMLQQIGSDDIVIVLCGGLVVEFNLVLECDSFNVIEQVFGVVCDVDGKLVVLVEILVVVNLVKKNDFSVEVNVQICGVGDVVWVLCLNVYIIEGCCFKFGLCELVVGQGV